MAIEEGMMQQAENVVPAIVQKTAFQEDNPEVAEEKVQKGSTGMATHKKIAIIEKRMLNSIIL